MEEVHEMCHQIGIKEVYQKRKETIEHVFAKGKENFACFSNARLYKLSNEKMYEKSAGDRT